MKQRTFTLNAFGFVLLCFGLISSAKADVQQAFVSVSGRDGAPCSDSHPCRTFAAGLTAVAAGGTVIAVDSGEFGPVVITKSVTIAGAPGVHAQISTSGVAVAVNAGSSDAVVLRNLVLNGPGVAGPSVGIQSGTVGALHVENCLLTGFVTGISFPSGQITLRDSAIRNSFATGLDLGALGNTNRTFASVERSQFEGNGLGLILEMFSQAVLRDSAFVGNSIGIYVFSNGAPSTVIRATLESCVVSKNSTGIDSENVGNIIIRVANSTITHNTTALIANQGSQFLSRGDNTVADNDGFENFTGAYSAK